MATGEPGQGGGSGTSELSLLGSQRCFVELRGGGQGAQQKQCIRVTAMVMGTGACSA